METEMTGMLGTVAEVNAEGGRAAGTRPLPRYPTSDPFAFVCEAMKVPKIGHQYALGRIGSVGPHWGGLCCTSSVVIVATIFLLRTASRGFPTIVHVACVLLALLTLVTLALTGLTDPGIVTVSSDQAAAQYCSECDLYVPRGCAHCEDCAVCVQGHDHHCPWIGKCVGQGNLTFFYLFNLSWAAYMVFAMGIMIARGGADD